MRKAILLVSFAALAGLVVSQTAIAAHVHPANNGATELKFTVVPAFKPCTTGFTGHHGTPLAAPSCAPPVQQSTLLTTGCPTAACASASPKQTAQGVSTFDILVICGATGTTTPTATGCATATENVKLTASSTDVRCKVGGAIASNPTLCGPVNQTSSGKDYKGQVQGNATIRITDAYNDEALLGSPPACSGTTTCSATSADLPFPVTGTCASTASATIGSICSVATYANSVVPGVVKKGKQANVEVGQILVNDGGTDGLATTGDNTVFARQGIYIP
jgi:hypothetical protein